MKKLILLCFYLGLVILTTACEKKTQLFLNDEPITRNNVLEGQTAFALNSKIYYLLVSKKPLKADFIRVQVSQSSNKGPVDSYNIVWANDYKIIKQNVYFYHDYFVPNSRGKFLIQIFDKNNYYKPLAYSIFWVR